MAKAKKPKHTVGSDGLAWKAVTLPDRLDDYEGFFGLEEVDDVTVEKDTATGAISFVPKRGQKRTIGDAAITEDGDDSWEGWNDLPTGAEPRRKKDHQINPKRTESPTKRYKNDHDPFHGLDSIVGDGASHDERDVSAWQALELSPDTLSSLARIGFSKPTPIQRAAIPEILAGHDVVGKASTGSGKTLAFGIPILERYLELRPTRAGTKPEERAPLALLLSPTRELAHQLDKHLRALCTSGVFEAPVVAAVTGGLSIQKQQRLLKAADIVIGTPGRLWEVMSSGQGTMAAMRRVEFLVIDEADRLLSEGHYKEVEEILNALDRQEVEADDDIAPVGGPSPVHAGRQTLVFSATFDRSLQKKLAGKGNTRSDMLSNKESLEYLLAKLNFREEKPKFVDVDPVSHLATGLKEGLISCNGPEKDLYLYALLLLHPGARTLVFTNSIDAVRRLTPFLQNLSLPAVALHSSMPQKARLRSVERFAHATDTGKPLSSIMVATDVAARGLDIPNVQLVIHYHLPRTADTYVHRSGRTARAGQTGSSILICGPEEVAGVRRLVAKVHARSAVAKDAADSAKSYFIRTLDIDRRVVSQLKDRANLAKKLADTILATEKERRADDFFRAAAEDLGVEYDSEELEKQGSGRRGRGSNRKAKERELRAMSKAEVAATRAKLKSLLKQRVNVGVSERYLTSSGIDVNELLRLEDAGERGGEFLGAVNDLGL